MVSVGDHDDVIRAEVSTTKTTKLANGQGWESNRIGKTEENLSDLSDDGVLDLSVVVPAYNEEERLPPMLVETLTFLERRRMQSLDSARTGSTADGNGSLSMGSRSRSSLKNGDNSGGEFSYEIIVVDDGSRDKTVEVVTGFIERASHDRVRLLKMACNSGKGAAVRHGVRHAQGAQILMADADAATNFSDLERLELALNHGADVAIGSRAHLRRSSSISSSTSSSSTGEYAHHGHAHDVKKSVSCATEEMGHRDILRAFISFFFNLLVVFVGGVRGLSDTQCGFKLYSRRAARAAFVGQHLTRWAFDVENLYRVQRARLSVVEVPVRWTEVPGSKLSVVKATINMAWDMFRMRYHYLTGSWSLPIPTTSTISTH